MALQVFFEQILLYFYLANKLNAELLMDFYYTVLMILLLHSAVKKRLVFWWQFYIGFFMSLWEFPTENLL